MAGVTGQQKTLTPPWHLILPSFLPGIRIALHSILYFPFWIVISFNTLLASLFDISKQTITSCKHRFQGTWDALSDEWYMYLNLLYYFGIVH
jgi:hypothetical protein